MAIAHIPKRKSGLVNCMLIFFWVAKIEKLPYLKIVKIFHIPLLPQNIIIVNTAMRKLIILFSLVFIPFFLCSQNSVVPAKKWGYKGYAGGMFVHSGYIQSKHFTVFDLQNNEIEQQIKGMCYGLGGKMGIFLHKYLRVGGEGYFSSCIYGIYKNSCRMGWGGITFDVLYPVKKWAPFLSITVGGGSATNLIFIEKQQNNREPILVVYFKNPLCIINPAVGVEFLASNRISVLFKMDYMLNMYHKNNSYPQGLRFYLGVHFYQRKNN